MVIDETNECEVAVAEFITKFDAAPPWRTLVIEEAKEVVEAAANLLKEVADFTYVLTGALITDADIENLQEDEPDLSTAFKWAFLLAEHNTKVVQDAFDLVHASNMSKLDFDGKPIKREDGKILKGANYKPADLSELVKAI